MFATSSDHGIICCKDDCCLTCPQPANKVVWFPQAVKRVYQLLPPSCTTKSAKYHIPTSLPENFAASMDRKKSLSVTKGEQQELARVTEKVRDYDVEQAVITGKQHAHSALKTSIEANTHIKTQLTANTQTELDDIFSGFERTCLLDSTGLAINYRKTLRSFHISHVSAEIIRTEAIAKIDEDIRATIKSLHETLKKIDEHHDVSVKQGQEISSRIKSMVAGELDLVHYGDDVRKETMFDDMEVWPAQMEDWRGVLQELEERTLF